MTGPRRATCPKFDFGISQKCEESENADIVAMAYIFGYHIVRQEKEGPPTMPMEVGTRSSDKFGLLWVEGRHEVRTDSLTSDCRSEF